MDKSLEKERTTIKNSNLRVNLFTCLWMIPQMISFIPIHLKFWAWWRNMMEYETVNCTDHFGHTFELTAGYNKHGVPGFVKGVEKIVKHYNMIGGCYIFHLSHGPGPLWFDISFWDWIVPISILPRIFQWDVPVVECFAMAKVQLRLPSVVVKTYIPRSVHNVFVIAQEQNFYNYVEICTRPGPNNKSINRFLAGPPWFDVVQSLNLRGGEKIVCPLKLETDVLFIHVVRDVDACVTQTPL